MILKEDLFLCLKLQIKIVNDIPTLFIKKGPLTIFLYESLDQKDFDLDILFMPNKLIGRS